MQSVQRKDFAGCSKPPTTLMVKTIIMAAAIFPASLCGVMSPKPIVVPVITV